MFVLRCYMFRCVLSRVLSHVKDCRVLRREGFLRVFDILRLPNRRHNCQEQLLYMRGLILAHVKKPMSRNQVTHITPPTVGEDPVQITMLRSMMLVSVLLFGDWYCSKKVFVGQDKVRARLKRR